MMKATGIKGNHLNLPLANSDLGFESELNKFVRMCLERMELTKLKTIKLVLHTGFDLTFEHCLHFLGVTIR